MVEQGTHKPLVGSSTLPPGTNPLRAFRALASIFRPSGLAKLPIIVLDRGCGVAGHRLGKMLRRLENHGSWNASIEDEDDDEDEYDWPRASRRLQTSNSGFRPTHDSGSHLPVVCRNTQSPQRSNAIGNRRMGEPQTDEQRMRSQVIKTVFTQAHQSFYQR